MKNQFKSFLILACMAILFGCSSSDSAADLADATCENDCLDQGGTDEVCADGCDGDDSNDCSDAIDDECFELCISSGNDAFDCAEEECDIGCATNDSSI